MDKLVSRRDFLKLSTAGAVGVAASVLASPVLAEEAKKVYTPGTYSASAQGLMGPVTVTMTFNESSITDVVIDASGETPEIGGVAAEKLAQQLLVAQLLQGTPLRKPRRIV